ncbi:MalY/PatB family protein [Lacisediminihabitans sp. FW035]
MTASLPNPLERFGIDELRERTSAKWRTFPDDVLPLWVAEMDVALAAPVAGAVRDAIARGDTGYAVGADYAAALRDFASERWGWHDLAVARTAVVADVMTGVVEMLRLVTERGSAVVINSPVYPPFSAFVTHADRRVTEARLGADGRIDFDELGSAFERASSTGLPAAFLLCNPHNPTGVVHTASELSRVAQLAARFGVRVVSDEIHAPLVLEGAAFVPYLSIPGAENAFAVMSASKGWNLAGLKAAVAIAGPDAATDLARMPETVTHGPSHLGVISHVAALRSGGDWLDALLSGLDQNRALLGRLIETALPQVGWMPPQGGYLAWLDCRALGWDAPAEAFLARSRVALSEGATFGTGGMGHVRLNFATSAAILAEAIDRLAAGLPGGQPGSPDC